MKGYYKMLPNGQMVEVSPCATCKHKNTLTVFEPCWSCQNVADLIFHTPVALSEFAHYEPEEVAEA